MSQNYSYIHQNNLKLKKYYEKTKDILDDITHDDCEIEYIFSSDIKNIEVNNNTFKAEKIGKYVIIYSATDASGNIGYKRLNISCEKADLLNEIRVASEAMAKQAIALRRWWGKLWIAMLAYMTPWYARSAAATISALEMVWHQS